MTAQLNRERLEEKLLEHIKHGGDSEEETMIRMLLAGMDSEPVAESVTCWSCKKVVEVSAIGDCDGYCPNCNSPIDLDDEPYITTPPAPVAVPECFVRFHRAIKERHHGRMPEEVQKAFDECDAMLKKHCTCPSGDGSLRWPCPDHPPEPVTAATVPDDTKRLDWLDAQNKRLNEYYGTSYGWKFDANFQRNAMMLNDSNYPVMTVRQAIDEAMLAAAPVAPEQEL